MSYIPPDPWPVNWAACPQGCDQSPAATGLAVKAASFVLSSLAGGQFGTQTATVRPCRRDCSPSTLAWAPAWPYPTGWPYPALVEGAWVNLACGVCQGTCTCQVLSEAVLPGPIVEVVEVKVDGVVLPATAYRLDRDPLAAGDVLVRVDGGAWPWCNNLRITSGPGAWSVTAQWGMPVPEAGQLAVGEFACEWFKAMAGQECGLPARLTSLARQGVTMSFDTTETLVAEGLVGLPLCDWFLRAANPHQLQSRARVLSVDTLPPRRSGVL